MESRKEDGDRIEPEILDDGTEAANVFDEEVEELHNSLKEVVQDPAVKPKFQCLMVDPSFSMVTVQSEDSGIVWETASSRCSTPWASEASSPSDSFSLEGSGTQGNIVIIMDEDKVRRRKKTRGKLGDRFRRPGSRLSGSAVGEERPAMIEVSLPNIRRDDTEDGDTADGKPDKDQELFNLISEGFEILNIVVPSKLPTVDEECSTELADNLSYLEDTPKIKTKCKHQSRASAAIPEVIDIDLQEIKDDRQSGLSQTPANEQLKKDETDMDYLEKFTLLDQHAPDGESRKPESTQDQEEQQIPAEEQKTEDTVDESSFVIVTEVEIAEDHLDEVFYGASCDAEPEFPSHHKEDKEHAIGSAKKLKEHGSALFESQDTILMPIFLPPGPPKIIAQDLLDEPRAMSFHYSDLYEDATGDRKRDDDASDVESVISEKSFKRRFSDSDDGDGYLEKFILKDDTPVVEDVHAVDTPESDRVIWTQNKFEMTGYLMRAQGDPQEEDVGANQAGTESKDVIEEGCQPSNSSQDCEGCDGLKTGCMTVKCGTLEGCEDCDMETGCTIQQMVSSDKLSSDQMTLMEDGTQMQVRERKHMETRGSGGSVIIAVTDLHDKPEVLQKQPAHIDEQKANDSIAELQEPTREGASDQVLTTTQETGKPNLMKDTSIHVKDTSATLTAEETETVCQKQISELKKCKDLTEQSGEKSTVPEQVPKAELESKPEVLKGPMIPNVVKGLNEALVQSILPESDRKHKTEGHYASDALDSDVKADLKTISDQENSEKLLVNKEKVSEQLLVNKEKVAEELPVNEEKVSEEACVNKEKVSEEVCVNEAKVLEEIPVTEEKVLEELLVSEAKVLEELPVNKTKVSEELPVNEAKIFEELPVQEEKVLEELSVKEEKVLEELSVKEEKVSEKLPVKEKKVSEELPVNKDKISEELTVKEGKISEELPVKEEKVSEELPVKEEKVPEELPVKEEKVPEELTVKEEKVPEELHVKEEKVPEELPVKEEKVSEELPVKEEKVPEELPIKEENVSDELPVKEEKVSEELTVKEEKVPEELPVKEEKVPEELTVKEEKVPEELTVKEEKVPEELTVKEEKVPEELTVKEEKVPEELTVKEEKVPEELTVKEEKVPEELTVKEGKISEELPVKEEKVPEELTVKEEKVPEELTVKEEKVPEELTVKEEKVPEELTVKEEKVPEELTVKEEKVPEELTVKEEKVPEELTVKEGKISEELPVKEEKVSEELPVNKEKVEELKDETPEKLKEPTEKDTVPVIDRKITDHATRESIKTADLLVESPNNLAKPDKFGEVEKKSGNDQFFETSGESKEAESNAITLTQEIPVACASVPDTTERYLAAAVVDGEVSKEGNLELTDACVLNDSHAEMISPIPAAQTDDSCHVIVPPPVRKEEDGEIRMAVPDRRNLETTVEALKPVHPVAVEGGVGGSEVKQVVKGKSESKSKKILLKDTHKEELWRTLESASPSPPMEIEDTTFRDSPLEEIKENLAPELNLKTDKGFSALRSFSPLEDLSGFCQDLPEVQKEMHEELDYEMLTERDARHSSTEVELGIEYQEPIQGQSPELIPEADYEFIEDDTQISEIRQLKENIEIQPADAFCLICRCSILVSDGGHENHEVSTLDKAFEGIKDQLSNWISVLQERSENIEDLVSELELAYNSVEDHCKDGEKVLDEQNEETLKLVMERYTEMSQTMEEEKKAKLEQLYDQIVSFQENNDAAKEAMELTTKEMEETEELAFLLSYKDIEMRLKTALDSAMSVELGPRGLLVFEDYAKGTTGNEKKNRQVIPVPQQPHLQPQEANSATSTSVTVYWTVNEGDIIDCFQVYCMEEPQGAISEEYRVTVKESHCNLEDLEPDKCYKVWVMAVNYTGCSLPSERLPFRTAPSVPVINPEACTVLWDSATIRWSSSQPSAAESFTLEYCRQYALEGEGLRSVSGIKGFQHKVLLQPNENFLFYIKSVNRAGASDQSEAALISTRGTRFHLLSKTANMVLKVSEDKNSVQYPVESYNQMATLIECPAVRGEILPHVGYHYWETVVADCKAYRIGVAYQTEPQDSTVGDSSASWCLHCVPTSISCRFELLHDNVESDIFVTNVPARIGTLLDFVQGRLVFFNALNGQCLGSFQQAFSQPCYPVLTLERPGNLELKMTTEVPEFAKHW